MSQGLSRSRGWGALLGLGVLLLGVGLGLTQGVEYADVNHDGEVNFLDVVEVQQCVGRNPQALPLTNCNMADTNRDNRVDALDLAIVTRQLGQRDYPFYIDPAPTTFVRDPRGGIYPINRVGVMLVDNATRADAETLAASVGGRVVGFAPSLPLCALEVPTTTIAELDALITQLEQDPRVIHAMPEVQMKPYESVPTDLTRLRRADPDLTRFPFAAP